MVTPASISLTLFNDPACPWGYSAIPALRTIEWRYGLQLDWRLVLIGLSEDASQYIERGYSPIKSSIGQLGFRRFGMPFAIEPKSRVSATAPACRVVSAARLRSPGSEWRVLRALQLAQFTSPLVLEDLDGVRSVLEQLVGLDADAIMDAVDSEAVEASYRADHAESRRAAGGPGALQGKTANTDGAERYTAPSVVFARDGQRLEATGFQPVEVYDVLVANLDPTLVRRGPAASALEVLTGLADSPHGPDVTTIEVAQIMAAGNDPVDRDGAEAELLQLVADGRARRVALGDGATWVATV
jgi:protein-disulfide isomerase-like protein with CxxC motif